MELKAAARIFATLGHPDRLAVLRLLMRFAPRPVRPTEIAEALGLRLNTLSHHLSDLLEVGLIDVQREGRSLWYSVNLHTAETIIGYFALDVARGRPEMLPTQNNQLDGNGYNVLFICSGNSARSIFAEALLRDLGQGRFNVYSAGTRPGSELNPFAVEVLKRHEHDVTVLRAKHISEFQSEDAPVMDFVFTVCDAAASEECPPWPGQPITGHWGLPDPVKATGTDAEKSLVFRQIYAAMRQRIEAFAGLPVKTLDRLTLQSRVDAIAATPVHLFKE